MEQKKMRPRAADRGTVVKKAVRENPEITVALQEGAVVVSASYKANMRRKLFSERLKYGLEKLAEAFDAREAIIGHIKASLDSRGTEMFSVTEREVCVKRGGEDELSVRLAAIVFAVSQEEALGLVREMFAELDRKR